MKALILYIAAGAIAVNVAGNLARNTAESLESVQSQRSEQLCQVNPRYCA